MPTSGEAKIRPTSTYNLRSRPLPRTRQAGGRAASSTTSKNKENIPHSGSKLKKSHIPVPVRMTPSRTTTKVTSTAAKAAGPSIGRPKTRAGTVPDFAKIHKSWQKSFNKGKAVNKKQCTQIREFDLTKPGTVFHPSYYDGKHAMGRAEEEDEDVFQTDDSSLQSILNDRPLTSSQQAGRFTMAGYGASGVLQPKPNRQTLGALPSTFQGRPNNAQNVTNEVHGRVTKLGETRDEMDPAEEEQPKSKSNRKPSLAQQQQQGGDINFEPDAGALASILNNTGADFRRQAPTTRQTVGAATGMARNHGNIFRQSQGPVRTSIYYQRPRNMNFNSVFTDFANHVLSRLSLADDAVSSASGQPLERPAAARATVGAQSTSKGGRQSRFVASAPRRMRTPATASRIPNPCRQVAMSGQDATSSPALRAPPSALKKASAHKEGKVHSVKWKDTLSPPGDGRAAGKDELATALFADEDTRVMEPLSLDQMVIEGGQLQLMAKQDEIKRLEQQAALHRNKLQEMDEIERQLELEIQKLQQEGSLLSPTTMKSRNEMTTDSQCNTLCPRTAQASDVPQPLLEVESEIAVRTPVKGHFAQTPEPDVAPSPPLRAKSEGAKELLFRQSSRGDAVHDSSATMRTSSHSQGNPFWGNQSWHRSDLVLPQSCVMQPQSLPGPDVKNPYGEVSQAMSERQNRNAEGQLVTSEIPQKPFSEMDASIFTEKVTNEDESRQIKEPEASDTRTYTVWQQLSPNQGLATGSVIPTQQGSETLPIWQPSPVVLAGRSRFNEIQGILQEPAKVPFGQSQLSVASADSRTQDLLRGHSKDLGSKGQKALLSSISNAKEKPAISQLYGSSNVYLPVQNKENDLRSKYQHDSVNHERAISTFYTAPSNSHLSLGFSAQKTSTAPQGHVNTLQSSTSTLPQNLQTPSRDPLFRRGTCTSAVDSLSQPFMSTGKDLNPQIPCDLPTTWMSSTPAHIQTPHAVKPHLMVKELALKHSLASSNHLGVQPAPCHQNAPPIQTPLAMRTMSMWNKDVDFGASPVHYVSPVALRSGHTSHKDVSEPKVTNFNLLEPQSGHVGNPTSATTETTGTSTDFKPLHGPASGLAGNPTPASNATNSEQGLQSEGEHSKSLSHLISKSQGSLSLGAELLTNGGAAAFLRNKMKPLLSNTTNQLFQEALLDEECALYACRLPSKFSPRISEDRQCPNPVAVILMDGDDMHFVPIHNRGKVYIASPVGSAFNAYSDFGK